MASVSLFTHFTLLFSCEEINFAFCVLSPASHHRLTTVIWSCSSSVLAGDCEILLRDSKIECPKPIFIWTIPVDFLHIFDRK